MLGHIVFSFFSQEFDECRIYDQWLTYYLPVRSIRSLIEQWCQGCYLTHSVSNYVYKLQEGEMSLMRGNGGASYSLITLSRSRQRIGLEIMLQWS
jgi:hypothetical protein